MGRDGSQRDFKALEKRRLKGLRLLRAGIEPRVIAKKLGVTRQSVERWKKKFDEGGQAALLWNGRAGRMPRMNGKQLDQLRQMLIEGPEKNGFDTPIWTCRRVATLIRNKFSIKYHHDHVWKILHGIGFSVQKPIRRARERDEKAIANWKSRRWPNIKKKPKNSAGK